MPVDLRELPMVQEAMAEGRREGRVSLVVRQLSSKFGELDDATTTSISSLTDEAIDQLAVAMLRFADRAEPRHLAGRPAYRLTPASVAGSNGAGARQLAIQPEQAAERGAQRIVVRHRDRRRPQRGAVRAVGAVRTRGRPARALGASWR